MNRQWIERYGPWAVVTGASSGIGRELSRQLGARGMNLVLAARSTDKLEKLKSELQSQYALDILCVTADLGTGPGIQALIDACTSLDIGLFIGNAGFGTSGPFIDSELENELSMIDLNVRSLAAQTHHFANQMRQRGSGGIILLSSIVSWQGVPQAANYAATKAYVQSLAEALSRELPEQGIDVLSSAPAQVSTGFMQRANMRSDGADPEVIAKKTLEALGKKTTVYPHFKSWFLSTALSTLPRFARVRILEKVMTDMTRHHKAESV